MLCSKVGKIILFAIYFFHKQKKFAPRGLFANEMLEKKNTPKAKYDNESVFQKIASKLEI